MAPMDDGLKQWVAFTATATGRDKINRTVAYFARFLAWYLARNGYSKEAVARAAKVQSQVGLARKLMRVGRPLDFVQAALRVLSSKDQVAKVLTILKSVGMSTWLIHDSLQYFHAVTVLEFEETTLARIKTRGDQFWLFALVVGAALNLWKLNLSSMKLERTEKLVRSLKGGATGAQASADGIASVPGLAQGLESSEEEVKILKSQQYEEVLSLIQNVLDIVVPAASLKYIDIESGYVGIIGVVSSLLGARSQWRSVNGKTSK